MAERCERTELLVDQCAHCRGVTEPAPARTVLGPWFPAGYPGWCSGCGQVFGQGDMIRADGCGVLSLAEIPFRVLRAAALAVCPPDTHDVFEEET